MTDRTLYVKWPAQQQCCRCTRSLKRLHVKVELRLILMGPEKTEIGIFNFTSSLGFHRHFFSNM